MTSLKTFASTRVVSGLVSIGLAFALVRWMDVEDFAKYIVLVSAAGVASLIASLGLDRVMYRYVPAAQIHGHLDFLRNLGRFAIISRLALSAVLSILILWITGTISQIQHSKGEYLIVCVFAAALGATDVLSILANSLLRFETQAKIGLVALLFRAGCLSLLALTTHSLDLDLVMLVLLAAEIAQSTALYAIAVRPELQKMAAPAELKGSEQPPNRAEIQRLAITNYLSYIIGLPWQGSLLRVLVGSFATVSDTALFGFLQTLADRLRQYLPIQLLQNALEPLLVRKHTIDRDSRALCNVLEMLRRINFTLLLIGVIVSMLVGNEVIAFVSKGKFTQAGNLCALIIFSLALNSIGGVLWISCNVLHQMTNLTRAFGLITLSLIPFLGLACFYGGSFNIALVTLLPTPLTWIVLRLKGNLASIGLWQIGKDTRALFSAISAFAVGWGIKDAWSTPIGMALAVLASIAAYLTLLWGLQVIKKADVRDLRTMLHARQKV
jgi:O-antigen/teichoic acid export membrane protein